MIRISELFVYPIKSCAGTAVDSFKLDRFGPENDRRWMIVDEAGVQITQRERARMALIKPTLTNTGLQVNYRRQTLAVDTPSLGRPLSVQVWADQVSALDAGDMAAEFVSGVLETPARLVWMPETTERAVDPDYASKQETVGFADGFPLLLIAQASLDDLNTRLEQAVPMNRFRPNIVVDGCEAFAEDSWHSLKNDDCELQVVKPCARCVMPSVIQETAEKDTAILRALASYRRGEDRQTYFGQNLLYQGTARLKIGDVFTAK